MLNLRRLARVRALSRRAHFGRIVLVRSVTNVPIAVSNPYVQTAIFLGGTAVLLAAIDWLRMRTGFLPFWVAPALVGALLVLWLANSAYQEWDGADEDARKLAELAAGENTPYVNVQLGQPNRVARDGMTRTAVLRVLNPRHITARDCEVRLMNLQAVPPTPALDLIPADGPRLLWSIGDPPRWKCTLTPNTDAIINIAYCHRSYPDKWYPFIDGGNTWELPVGDYNLTLDVISPDFPAPQTERFRIEGHSFDHLVLKAIPLPDFTNIEDV
jgi:hypothetical protein